MDQESAGTMRKSYRRRSIPKDEALVRETIPGIRDACLKLHEMCTCTIQDRTKIRPASETDEEYFAALADLFRCYRWLAGVAEVDDLETKEKCARSTIQALREGIDVIERVIPFTEPSAAHPYIRVSIRDAMTCGMQALANCVRNSTPVQDAVWSEFFEIIGSLIILEEDKLLNCICAVIMNCLSNSRLDQIVDRGYAARIFERISYFGAREDSLVAFEAVFDLSRHLLRCSLVSQRDYDLLPLSARCTILDLLSSSFTVHASMTSFLQPDNSSLEFCQESLLPNFWPEKMADEFKNNSMCLTRLREHSAVVDEECELALKILNLLGNITSSDDLRRILANDVTLLDRVIDLFLTIDEIGRSGDNLFSPVTKMANIKPQELVTPSRGLKSQLLRLLANLVYENPGFEVRARESALMSRLKDSTRIDYRNPYVQQWAILAIRNLHFSALLEEIRKEQEVLPVQPVPGLAHSVDGDMMGERKLSDGLTPHRMKGFQHSNTVEALDLHTSFSESLSLSQSKPGTASARKEHKSSKHQHHNKRPSKKTFEIQGTQTGDDPPKEGENL